MRKIPAILMLITSLINASEDNRLTMTDLKEALYTLIQESNENDIVKQKYKERLEKLEVSVPTITKNSNNISAIVMRINELGVPAASQMQETSSEIDKFVKANQYLLPKNEIK